MDELDAQDVIRFIHRVEREIMRNDLQDYLIAAGLALGVFLLVLALRWLFRRRLTNWIAAGGHRANDALVKEAVTALFSMLFIAPFYAATTVLSFSKEFAGGIAFVFLVLFTWRATVFFSRFFVAVIDSMLSRSASYMGVRAVSPIITFVVWAVGVSFLLDNIGLKVSSIMAGLGIVGIAVGLASQAVLGDFFGYLSILLDRPFKIGDVVSAGSSSGTVERVGFKTTKLRTPTGEVIYAPNGDLSKQSLTNSTLTRERGRVFQFGVAYETPLEKVKAIPDMLREVVEKEAGARLVRVHFTDFADSSLLFEAQFMVKSNRLTELLDTQHAINIALMERFAAEGIIFAYPTNTLYFANELRLDKAAR